MLSNEHRELLSSLPFPERRRWTLTILGIEGIVTRDPGRADWPMPADAVLDTLEQIDNLPRRAHRRRHL